jgi:hypothetical protein
MKGLSPHHLDRSDKQRLATFTADKNTTLLYVPNDVVTDFLAGFELEVAAFRIVHDVRSIGAVEAFIQKRNQATSLSKKPNLTFGNFSKTPFSKTPLKTIEASEIICSSGCAMACTPA